MSETGGARLQVPAGCMDDILGFPVPKENFRIQDVMDRKFYSVDDGVRTGIMYLASDSLCMNELDGEVLFSFTEIDGRADRYFVNNEGIHFDAGIVEIAISRCEGTEKCAIVPLLDKRIHDTVPALYAVPEKNCKDGAQLVRKALIRVYIDEDLIGNDILPTQFILAKDLPCNANGKIDIYRITRERLKGDAYDIVPIKKNNKLIDIEINYIEKTNSITAGTLPEGMEGRSALNLYDLFNS